MSDSTVPSNITLDLLSLCRVCTSKTCSQIKIFEVGEHGTMSLADMVLQCTQVVIEKNDQLPQNICSKCCENLDIAYQFQHLVQESDDKFRQILASKQTKHELQQPSVIETVLLVDDGELGQAVIETHLKRKIKDDYGQSLKKAKSVATKKYQELNFAENIRDPTAKLPSNPRNRGIRKMGPNFKQRIQVSRVRTEAVKFECYKCRERTPNLFRLQCHMKAHKVGTPNFCVVCEMHFSNEKFKTHVCYGESIQCEYCSETFEATQDLLKHLELHASEQVINNCMYCKNVYAMKRLMELHLRHHHKTKLYKCNDCDHEFWSRESFKKHNHLSERSNI